MIGFFLCAVAYVTDGDTLRCTSGTRVRLAGIDAAEMPGHCARWRQCTPGNPFAAKASLERLVAGRELHCEAVGKSYNRILSFCRAGNVDVGCAQVRSGYAVKRYSFARWVCRR